ncbi:MAG TPA: AbrB family transcriptional regulator [Casimicrobiaceae bacterium]
MTSPARPSLRDFALALGVAFAAGAACAWLRTPIPWMLGPLFATAALRVTGSSATAPPGAREAGQWIIGTALGLYFTPVVVAQIGDSWWLLAAGATFAIAIGYVAAALLAKLAGIDLTTALFACVPGGAAEMSRLGELHGARPDKVAAGQSLRILVVVALVPAAFTLYGAHGSDAYQMGTRHFDAAGFALLLLATGAGGALMARTPIPNPYVLGALVVSIALTANEVRLSSLPTAVSNAGQLLLGCALGSRFQRDFLEGAPRFVASVVATSLVTIVLSALFAFALASVSGLPVPTLVLGLAPGGMPEMAITAKVLQLGVPLVTSFHVTRLVVLLLLTGPLFRHARGVRRRLRR